MVRTGGYVEICRFPGDLGLSVLLPELNVALIGAACRLPGAPDESAFHALLDEARCAVRPAPQGRWNVERYLHPRTTEPGFSYSFAGGYLDAPFAFDPQVFGMSPREATQMDPQQRLLLEVVWEALEDARIAPSSLAGTEVGVYVGASSLDYGNLHASDPASIDSYFMTGNTLSVVANRISYIFDWRGPSFTVDTACSSSLVAFAQAMSDLRSGRIDTAVVAGVNVLLSPASFIGFSRASMLSPTGLCRSFSADGDGYVRGEGAVAFVLRRADLARPGTIRAHVVTAGVNSDGRTSGIALPGLDGQVALLERLYRETGFAPDDLAFVEAHGTGTRVGDPIEATAIGRVLGQGRAAPLPIGSVKSNIGHLEPASGVAGMLKALHALESRRLPATLHIEELNPLIDFEELNLAPAREAVALDATAETLACGISSFGFGGTNAHVVLRSAPRIALPEARTATEFLTISAAGRDSLRAAVAAHAELIDAGVAPARLAEAVAVGRDMLKHRAVVLLDRPETLAADMRAYAENGKSAVVVEGSAAARKARICFVYSGNGAQWVGMGRAAYACNAAFRARFDEIDAAFARLAGRSLVADLHATDLEEQMRFGAFIQPLLFAVQSAVTAALVAAGVEPAMVLGHSVGELAAADAAGIVELDDALRIVQARSSCQEAVHGLGTMAVFAAGRDAVADFLTDLGRDDIEIAADNGPNSVTVAGSVEAVRLAAKLGRKRRLASRILDIEYPFHSRFLDGLRERMHAALGEIHPAPARLPLISTVSGEPIGERLLDADHWWLNVREPVRFREAIEAAAGLGAELFVEIGPRPILLSPIADTLKQIGAGARTVASLCETDGRDPLRDPLREVLARLVANGWERPAPAADVPVDRSLALPHYAWHRSDFRFHETSERLDVFGASPRHPLIGNRLAQGQHEWRTLLDAEIVPYLADHVVDGEIVVPGAALAEMLLAVARELVPEGPIGFEDFDILMPLVLPTEAMREISVRHAETTGVVEVWSRPRLGPDEWSLHGRARLVSVARTVPHTLRRPTGDLIASDSDAIYTRASVSGVDYGPAFRRALATVRDGEVMEVKLTPAEAGTGHFACPQLLHPASLDASLHGLFDLAEVDPLVKKTHLPVRFGRLVLYRDHGDITDATLVIDRQTKDSLTVSISLLDGEGTVVAEVDRLLLRSVVLGHRDGDDVYFHVENLPRAHAEGAFDVADLVARAMSADDAEGVSDGWLMLRAHMRAVAHRALSHLAGGDRRVDLEALEREGRLAPAARAFATMLAEELLAAELAVEDGAAVILATDTGLPYPEPILATFAAEFPGASAELLLAARTAAEVDTFLALGTPIGHRVTVLEQFEAANLLTAPARRAFDRAVADLATAAGPVVPRIVVAEPDCRGLLSGLLPRARRGELRVAVAGADRSRLEHLAARLPAGSGIDTVELAAAPRGLPAFDLAVVHAFRVDRDDDDLFGRLAGEVVEGGAVLVVQPVRDPLVDFYLGTSADWFARSVDPSLPIGRVPTLAETRRRLERAGLLDIRTLTLGDDVGAVLVAHPPVREPAPAFAAPVRIDSVSAEADGLATALAARVTAEGGRVVSGRVPSESVRLERVCLVAGGAGDDRMRTEAAIATIRAALAEEAESALRARLRIVIRSGSGTAIDPVAEAIRDFVRVVLNEHADLDVHLIDVDPALDDASAAARLVEWLAAGDGEREVAVGPEGVSVPRVRRGLALAEAARVTPEAMTLSFPRRGALEHFSWQPTTRVAPKRDEVEIAVVSTGLNFRDVMLAMGLLDDDVLDDGMAGAVYGFECVGRVTALGDRVRDLAIGEVVFGFAASAFSTHVTAPRSAFVSLPAGIDPEGASSIPVAFLTAWYGLVELARVKRGESVLIHGAAGGVGLAAIQIARACGARVVATVSTPDKRALVELFGAEFVYDSRSLAFADQIRDDLGGVDVVLNSLSGDAMRAGIKCLKPFGRFIELGKRDYVANTELGLRPFRRNLTYFGVDVDQLLAHDPRMVAKGLKALVTGFAEGVFTALPYRVFGADEIGEAFRLMQSAGHVGKIVVRPPDLEGLTVQAPPSATFTPGDGVQLVVGGTGGFGFATACWLAEKGASRIVVASRRGAVGEADEARIAALRARGIAFEIETVDAGNPSSVEALILRVTEALGPISGVWLTAMVLDDGLISGLDEARISRVLVPKIDGAANLDRATRGQPIEHFVLFSSATTLVGSPGQASYVAANGWLHGLARRRRAEGLPALAVAWGAIADVGVLARDGATAKKLERVTGVVGLASFEALHRLDALLARGTDLADPVVYCARFQRVGAMRDLPILATPAFEDVFGGDADADVDVGTDLATLIDGKSDAEAQKILGELIAIEVARILRLSAAEVDLGRPLDELGLDSLMALELRMNVENKFGIELPLVAITSVKNLHDLGRRMLQTLRAGDEPEADRIDAADSSLIAMHGGDEAAFSGLAAELDARRESVGTLS